MQSDCFLFCHNIYTCVAQWMLHSVPVFCAFVCDRKLIWLHIVPCKVFIFTLSCLFVYFFYIFYGVFVYFCCCCGCFWQITSIWKLHLLHLPAHNMVFLYCVHLYMFGFHTDRDRTSKPLSKSTNNVRTCTNNVWTCVVCKECQNLCKFPENRHAFFVGEFL